MVFSSVSGRKPKLQRFCGQDHARVFVVFNPTTSTGYVYSIKPEEALQATSTHKRLIVLLSYPSIAV